MPFSLCLFPSRILDVSATNWMNRRGGCVLILTEPLPLRHDSVPAPWICRGTIGHLRNSIGLLCNNVTHTHQCCFDFSPMFVSKVGVSYLLTCQIHAVHGPLLGSYELQLNVITIAKGTCPDYECSKVIRTASKPSRNVTCATDFVHSKLYKVTKCCESDRGTYCTCSEPRCLYHTHQGEEFSLGWCRVFLNSFITNLGYEASRLLHWSKFYLQ